MKPRNRKQKMIAEINITPFTDVILVLLIIFMITTPLIIQSNLKVNLPRASSAKSGKGTTSQVNITITGENLLYFNSQLATRKELREKMAALHRDNPDVEVILSSDRLVKFKEVVDVLDLLNELGIKNLNIAAVADN
jgi:TonB system transport protein ExbD (group 2)